MKILVGIDGSKESYDTLKFAINEAKIKKAKLAVIFSLYGGTHETVEEVEEGREIIKKAEKIMKDEGIEPDAHLLITGHKPAVDIVMFAEDNGYEHIIVGSHGLTGISRILLGSVAREVVEKAHCPVTVFRK